MGWQFQVPLWLILLLAVAAGAVLMAVGVLLGMCARSRRDRRSAAAQRLQELAEPAHPASAGPAPSAGVPSPAPAPLARRRPCRTRPSEAARPTPPGTTVPAVTTRPRSPGTGDDRRWGRGDFDARASRPASAGIAGGCARCAGSSWPRSPPW
ncbi:hypothetical protein ACIA5G_52515 [Amycolatopsis sp. NPDC051758]|uniref:hypothetical protein n=1 Tax=Amycolatopsis sp. NPDC051758 TaxID=3363935 RepID=UPI00378F3C29